MREAASGRDASALRLATLLWAAVSVGCFAEIGDALGLAAAVGGAYPGGRVDVRVHNGHKTITVSFEGEDTPAAGLGEADLEAKAREIGLFILERTRAPENIDDIRVLFETLEERPDGGRIEQRVEFLFDPTELVEPTRA